MQSISSLITSNAELSFAFFAVLGAVAHWVKKAINKDFSWDPIEYWFTNYPGRSVAAIGVLVVAVWTISTSGQLDGMSASMLVGMAFALGWAVDSGANKGAYMFAPSPSFVRKAESDHFVLPRQVKVPPLMGRKTRKRSTKAKEVIK